MKTQDIARTVPLGAAVGIAVVISLALIAVPGGAIRSALAGAADKKLEVYWVDVEGGAATLLVTPAGESVLIDVGFPGDRDADRIKRVADLAGLQKIDHVVITHFHPDHFGGLADLAARLPIGMLYTRDLSGAPARERAQPNLGIVKDVKVDKRVRIKPGAKIALKSSPGAARLTFDFIGADEKFGAARGPAKRDLCKDHVARPVDESDNKNSVVMMIGFGAFRLFVGGDLTWNTEAALLCPRNLLGKSVDVFQSDHHGLDQSNNPVLINALAPTVAVINNSASKGSERATLAAFKANPAVKGLYQLHRNTNLDPAQNTAPALIANSDENCAGNHIKLSVEKTGKAYTMDVPATGHTQTFATKP